MPSRACSGPDSVTWRIHSDPSMLVAGFRALLLQATHPLVFAGFEANSSYRADPWGRLRRTERVDRHGHVRHPLRGRGGRRRGCAPSTAGCAPASSRRPAGRSGSTTPSCCCGCTAPRSTRSCPPTCAPAAGCAPGEADRYVDEMRESARLVGLDPADRARRRTAELADYLTAVRPQLHVTSLAAQGAIWGFVPPMPLWVRVLTPARPAWATHGLDRGRPPAAVGPSPLRPARPADHRPGGRRRRPRPCAVPCSLLPDRVAQNPAYAAALTRYGAGRDRLAAATRLGGCTASSSSRPVQPSRGRRLGAPAGAWSWSLPASCSDRRPSRTSLRSSTCSRPTSSARPGRHPRRRRPGGLPARRSGRSTATRPHLLMVAERDGRDRRHLPAELPARAGSPGRLAQPDRGRPGRRERARQRPRDAS